MKPRPGFATRGLLNSTSGWLRGRYTIWNELQDIQMRQEFLAAHVN